MGHPLSRPRRAHSIPWPVLQAVSCAVQPAQPRLYLAAGSWYSSKCHVQALASVLPIPAEVEVERVAPLPPASMPSNALGARRPDQSGAWRCQMPPQPRVTLQLPADVPSWGWRGAARPALLCQRQTHRVSPEPDTQAVHVLRSCCSLGEPHAADSGRAAQEAPTRMLDMTGRCTRRRCSGCVRHPARLQLAAAPQPGAFWGAVPRFGQHAPHAPAGRGPPVRPAHPGAPQQGFRVSLPSLGRSSRHATCDAAAAAAACAACAPVGRRPARGGSQQSVQGASLGPLLGQLHAAQALAQAEDETKAERAAHAPHEQAQAVPHRAQAEDETKAERALRELDLGLLDAVTWPCYVWEWLRDMGSPLARFHLPSQVPGVQTWMCTPLRSPAPATSAGPCMGRLPEVVASCLEAPGLPQCVQIARRGAGCSLARCWPAEGCPGCRPTSRQCRCPGLTCQTQMVATLMALRLHRHQVLDSSMLSPTVPSRAAPASCWVAPAGEQEACALCVRWSCQAGALTGNQQATNAAAAAQVQWARCG